ncbi:MAG: hypothetical protein HXY38_00835 [Chloroflexi bacterium]|nr:hypothetical protein [Chloroflexota bacterium]
MNQWLYRIQPTRPAMLIKGTTPQEADIVSRHFSYLKDLTEKGVMILVGRALNTDMSSFGICIFEAEDESAARTIMEADPAVMAGVMLAECFPFRIALMEK